MYRSNIQLASTIGLMMGKNELHFPWLWTMLGWSYVAVICVLSLLPEVPATGNITIPHVDKIFHLVAYSLMAFWFSQLYLHTKSQIRYVMIFFCISFLLEWIQPLTGHRQFEQLDLFANGIGLLLGAMLARRLSISLFPLIEANLIEVL